MFKLSAFAAAALLATPTVAFPHSLSGRHHQPNHMSHGRPHQGTNQYSHGGGNSTSSLQARQAGGELISGQGDGTYYYQPGGAGPCGKATNLNSYPENKGYAMCESSSAPKQLESYNNQNIVAIANKLMKDNLQQYCGKQVEVQVQKDGAWQKSPVQFVLWDGCEACNNNGQSSQGTLQGGIDFSDQAFADLFGAEEGCQAGRVANGVQWKLLDNYLGPDGNGGSPSSSSTPSDPASANAPSASTSASTPAAPSASGSASDPANPTAPSASASNSVPAQSSTMPAASGAPTASTTPADSSAPAAGGECEPGAWKCEGNSIKQCDATGKFLAPITCSGAPTNCDGTPVCG